MNSTKSLDLSKVLVFVLLGIFLGWWVILTVLNPEGDFHRLLYASVYGIMALFGGLYGLFTAKKWGGTRSALGRTVLFLGLGLLFAEFGQLAWSYYNLVKGVESPYPSIADVGFFGNIPFYILAAFSLSKVTGVGLSIKKAPWKLLFGIGVPLSLLVVSYVLFLKGYDATEVPLLTKFLDFGYPLGQAIYVSFALVILLSVGRMLGGIFKRPAFLLLIGFFLQYCADFNFLYQNSKETWITGGYGDLIYLFSYTVMALALIKLSTVYEQLGNGEGKTNG